MDESKWERWGNYEWKYLAGELETLRGMMYELVSKHDTDGVGMWLAEALKMTGRFHLDDLEMILFVEEMPYTIAGLPIHTLGEGFRAIDPSTQEDTHLAAYVIKYDSRYDIDCVYEDFGTTWMRNLQALSYTGIPLQDDSAHNMFSLC